MNKNVDVKPRIAIYGVGFVAKTAIMAADAMGWPIVAAYNRAGAKIGQDIGEYAGLGRKLGVLVEDCDQADYDKLEADIALVMVYNYLELNMPIYERFLTRGIDVLCHGAQSINPYVMDKVSAKKIDTMATASGATFTGGGIWDMSRVWAGMMVAGPCMRLNSLTHYSSTDILRQATGDLSWTGVGLTQEEFADRNNQKKVHDDRAFGLDGMYGVFGPTVLEHLGFTPTTRSESYEPVIWEEDYVNEDRGLFIPAGDCVGGCLAGETNSEEGVSVYTRIEFRVFREWDEEEMHWKTDGFPNMEIRVRRHDTGSASASSLFNRIPNVLAARPGIVPITQMGILKPCLSG